MAKLESPFGHEPSAIAVRRVLAIGAALAFVVLTSAAVLHFVLHDWLIPQRASVVLRPDFIPPQPRLQPSPQNDLAMFRAQKEALLSGYAWTDASHAYARIPVTRATQIYAQRHAVRPTKPSRTPKETPR